MKPMSISHKRGYARVVSVGVALLFIGASFFVGVYFVFAFSMAFESGE